MSSTPRASAAPMLPVKKMLTADLRAERQRMYAARATHKVFSLTRLQQLDAEILNRENVQAMHRIARRG